MNANGWKLKLGEDAWNHIVGDGAQAECIAEALTRATEVGFAAPVRAPEAVREGRVVLWAGADPVLTADGLSAYWKAKGHGFMLLRAEALVRSHAGPMLPRIQESILLYEQWCADNGLDPLPDFADFRYFVGGGPDPFPGAGSAFVRGIIQGSPVGDRKVMRARPKP